MTERLADITRRIESVRELDLVVTAMRGIAASRAQECRAGLAGVGAYAEVIDEAIATALPLAPPRPIATHGGPRRGHAVVLFGAEQGFAGAFTDRVLEAAGPLLDGSSLFLLGTRARLLVEESGMPIAWRSAMPPHPEGVPVTADRVAEALYDSIAAGGIDQVSLVFPVWSGEEGLSVETRQLLPFDFRRFAVTADDRPARQPPLFTLPADILLTRLVEEYVFAEICAAALRALAAENEARMAAMIGAKANIERVNTELGALERRTRQEEITAEVTELAGALITP